MTPVVFLFLLLALFILSKKVAQGIGSLIFRISGSKKATVGILAFIFLPGTVIHEFAHAAVAQGLGVYVGEIEFTPTFEGDSVKLGSVQVAQSDPFRQFLIGAAPLIIGFVLIFLTFALYDKFQISGFWPQVLLFYILFEIGNTMFSSKRDMEGALELFAAVTLVLGFVYLLGFRQIFDAVLPLLKNLDSVFKMASDSLVKIIIIDVIIIASSRLFTPKNHI
ncbi:MAG: hypothetical protein Q8P25_01655 [Candidatus Curtissbacteria bacterium]|nr:hypothetical protein [Candidatus Curtissbacteria bacterium]